jgi:acyl-CoA thioester hydrolase
MRTLGYSMADIAASGVGAVLLKEETEYYREIFLSEKVSVEIAILGESLDHSKWKFLHNIYNSKNQLSAKHIVYGAWINTKTRKICPPPADFIQLIENLPKCENFTVI